MALIKCPECGKEISDKAPACPNCGCPIQPADLPISASPKTTEEQPKKNPKAAVIAVIAAIAVLGVLCAAYFAFLSPGAKLRSAYNKASALYNAGNYSEALPMFEDLGEYSNSADSAVWCRYELAKAAISRGEYKTAKEYLDGTNYADSAGLIRKCDYQLGVQAMEAGNWEKAKAIFQDLDFADSKDLSKKCDYQLGIQAMKARDWKSAASLFEGLDYEDSKKMLTDCSFILALEESITRRMEINAKESSDVRTITNTELAYLKDFKNAVFYNQDLKTLALKYISGLTKQLSAIDGTYEYYCDYQEDYYEGMVARYEVLYDLNKNYGFLDDNADFVGTYVMQLEYYQNWLKAFKAIQNDILSQEKNDKITVKKKGSFLYVTYTNNTKYTFSATFDFYNYADSNKNGKSTKYSYTIKDIAPGGTYTAELYYTGGYIEWSIWCSSINVN